ncbi:MAG TPA: peptidyl-prolyl cis-trans isomerase [Phycisphaerales bacterium]|nr:peptidyl-prolyl cis-trans isomerase [Phycisphaerales bacterium]
MKTSVHVAAVLVAAGLGGCATGGGNARSGGADQRPAALMDGREVRWGDLLPGLAELAGGQVLEEVVLDALLERRCAERGVEVGPEEIALERALLIESLDASADRAEEMLRVVRSSRGLGEARFAGALRRSAMLRALAGEDASEVAAEVKRAERALKEERSVVRVIVTANEAAASTARARVVERGDAADAMRFAAVAAELSDDESAAVGGLVGEVTASDSRLPAALRSAVARTASGQVTPVVSTGTGFAIALVERRLPGREALTAEELTRLQRTVRTTVQRRAMERLARAVLADARVVPMDRGLGWSWDQRRR